MKHTISNDTLSKMFVADDLTFHTKVKEKKNISDIIPIVKTLEENSKDTILEVPHLTFGANAITPTVNGEPMTQWSFSQLCSLLGVPAVYMEKLLAENTQEAEGFFVDQLDYWKKGFAGKGTNVLLRSTADTLCGVLSANYCPYDDSEFFETVEDATRELNLTVSNSTISPSVTKLRLVNEERINFGGEELSWGLDLSNSRVGRASAKAEFILFRWACTNGLAFGKRTAHLFRKTHRGEIDNAEIKSLIARSGDFVEYARKSFENGVNTEVTSGVLQNLLDTYSRTFSTASANKVLNMYETKYNTGNLWGVVNAITETAQGYNVITRTEMETYAGELLGRKVA